jgi:RNA polymerase sigma-70 factor (ECF subfamily)
VDLNDHLFRHESGRMVVALTRIFGVHNLPLVEDVVQHAFVRALEVWKLRGVPDNPSAWLMATARNRALDVLRGERTARTFAPELGRLLDTEWTIAPLVHEAFAAHTIRDEQLRMMFSCCHPQLPEVAQVALILNILCGFGADEVAAAFFTGRAAMEKRIARGKKTLARSKTLFDLADSDFASRLSAVRRALYLLFNEGYHGASARNVVRVELCREAMRLVELLWEHAPAATPETHALAALMYLHAARLPARIGGSGEMTPLAQQDRSLWDARLIARGVSLLEHASAGNDLSAYHVEAAIAATHASARHMQDTDWSAIVWMYDKLSGIAPSPVVSLNRAIAIGERDGAERGLEVLHGIADRDRLAQYPFYFAALGELELRRGKHEVAGAHFAQAALLGRNAAERRFLAKRVAACRSAEILPER